MLLTRTAFHRGLAPSVDRGSEQLSKLTGGKHELLERDASRELWRTIRELELIPVGDGERLWRFSLPPAQSAELPPALAASLQPSGGSGLPTRMYDWGGGQVWCVLPENAEAGEIHRRAREAGGNARIVRGGATLSVETPVFPPLAPPIHKLHMQLKDAFDPNRVLNPGRMYAGV